jgi:hypothetical protein
MYVNCTAVDNTTIVSHQQEFPIAVETFFRTMRGHMRAQDYRVVVEKSHRRLHPDRWSARGLPAAIRDDDARGMIEVAANTVDLVTPATGASKPGL